MRSPQPAQAVSQEAPFHGIDKFSILIMAFLFFMPLFGVAHGYPTYGFAIWPDYNSRLYIPQDIHMEGSQADEQLGLGGSLAMGDINGDGKMELLTGSSQYSGLAGRVRAHDLIMEYGTQYGSLQALVELNGQVAGLELGKDGALACADVNGDGLGDVLAGAPQGSLNGRLQAGSLHVVFGSETAQVRDIGPGQYGDLVIWGAAAGDMLSYSGAVHTGDLNGDKIADIIVAAPLADPQGRVDAGELYVVFGAAGLAGERDPALGEADLVIQGAEAGDALAAGGAIRTGDVNGDGIADLVFAAHQADALGRADAGQVYVVLGSPALGGVVDLAAWDQDFTIHGAFEGNRWGGEGTLVLGDVNADGIADILAGSSSLSFTGNSQAGAVAVVFGSPGLAGAVDLQAEEMGFGVTGPGGGAFLSKNHGISVTDFNGDGVGDIVMGAPGASPLGRAGAGAVYVVFGHPGLSGIQHLLFGEFDAALYGDTAESGLAWTGVHTGDLNGDGLGDILCAAPKAIYSYYENVYYYNYGSYTVEQELVTVPDVGKIYVVFGEQNPPPARDLSDDAGIFSKYAITRGDTGAYQGLGGKFISGSSFVMGDVNGDGRSDVAMAAPHMDGAEGALPNAGAVLLSESTVYVYGDHANLFETATVKRTVHSGDSLPIHFESSQAVMDFESATGPGLAQVDLYRCDSGASLPQGWKRAPVHWNVETQLGACSGRLTLSYVEDDIVWLKEDSLALFVSPTEAGPYSRVTLALDAKGNRASINYDPAFKWLVLAGKDKAELPFLVDLAKNKQEAIIYSGEEEDGANDYSWMQSNVLLADVNADGVKDLVRAGFPGCEVYFGRPDWAPVWEATGVNAPGPDMSIIRTDGSGGYIYEDRLISGDINGDGVADLILSGPGRDYVVYGKPDQPEVLDLTAGQADFEIAKTGVRHVVAVGDVTGDGYDDIIIAAEEQDIAGRGQDVGKVFVVFGGPDLPPKRDLDSDTEGFMEIWGPQEWSMLGSQWNMSLGDFNGDAVLDLVMSGYFDRAVFIIFGSNEFPLVWDLLSRPADVTLRGAFQHWHDMAEVGDFNGDGVDDLVVSMSGSYYDYESGLNIIYGGKNMPQEINLPADASVFIHCRRLDLGSNFKIADGNIYHYSFFAVGDINGDGLDDLAAVQPFYEDAAYVVFGSKSMDPVIDVGNGQYDMVIHPNFSSTYGFVWYSGGGYFPGVKMADVNGDGLMDIGFSLPEFASLQLEAGEYIGAVFMVYGSPSPPRVVDLARMDADVAITGPFDAGWFTQYNSFYFGDITADGVDDMAMTAFKSFPPWYDPQEADNDFRGRSMNLVMGRTVREQAAVKKTDHAGRGLARDYGTARAKIAFDSGAASSLTSVTLTRSYTGLNLPDLSLAAPVQWQVETDRPGFQANLTLQYLDSEIAGLNEASLALYQAPTPDGPFTRVENAVFDQGQNRVSVSGLDSLSCFVLQDDGLTPPCFLNSLPRPGAGR